MENYAKTHQVYSLVKVLQAYDFVLQTFLETWKHQSNFSQFTPEINHQHGAYSCDLYFWIKSLGEKKHTLKEENCSIFFKSSYFKHLDGILVYK